jgi:hypothetical protein
MKKQSAFLFFITITIISNLSVGQPAKWDYPIKPGSSQWRSFKTTNEMIQVCQIPEDVLKKLTTEELIRVCMNYPLLRDYTSSNSPYIGIMSTMKISNGFAELVKRKDSSKALLAFYKNENVDNIINIKDKAGYGFDFCALELVFCHDTLIKHYDSNDKKQLFKLFLSNLNNKSKYKEEFGFWGKMTTAFISNKYAMALGKIESEANKDTTDLIQEQKRNSKKMFLANMKMTDSEIIDEILAENMEFLEKLK